jgi:hypothetical protein
MPALNFMARFAAAVESGEKRQTIRKRRKDGRDPKPGDTLYFYTGMRTKKCRKLGEARCKSVSDIELDRGRFCTGVAVGTVRGITCLPDTMARRDGFADFGELLDCIEGMHGLPFEGLLIQWANPTPAAGEEKP